MSEWVGVHVDAITPRGNQGDVDIGATFELVDYLCAAGVRGIVLFGVTGEYPAFYCEERSRLIYMAAKRSRVPVMAGAGGATLDQTLENARGARESGASAIVVPPPFCVRFEADDLREFFWEFERQLGGGVPLYLANIPAFCSAIPVEVAAELMASGKFAGIVDGCGASGGETIVGDDERIVEGRRAGCRGVLSAAACAIPEVVVALDRVLDRGDALEVDRLDGAVQEFCRWAKRFPSPAAIQAATAVRGRRRVLRRRRCRTRSKS